MSNKASTEYVLVLNSGSSSIKFQVIDPRADSSDDPLVSGLVERIGETVGHIKIDSQGVKKTNDDSIADHAEGLERAFDMMADMGVGLQDLNLIAVGHRVVQGGSKLSEPVIITDDVVKEIDAQSNLAPLHNPPNLVGIEEGRALLPNIPHVAVFDTGFFATLPPEASTYAIDRDVAEKHGIRRYGFHGTSHEFVSRKVAEFLDKDYEELNQITLHLGNGASATAIREGKAVDTSMGLTPLAGLVMGTRTGDIDPGVIFHLVRAGGMSVGEIDNLLNRKSGLKGMTGFNDFRELKEKLAAGDETAQRAFDVYIHQLRHYIGAYMLTLGRTDVITFTAGVGENATFVRSDAMKNLENFGIKIDEDRNENKEGIEGPRVISTDDSAVTVMVVPTNEEMAIARYALELSEKA